jgi:hypothetical protein
MLGKSIYIWQISAICGGDVNKIAATLRAAGFQSAILHDAHLENWRTPARIALIAALKAVGIEPTGGAAVYGANPALEGQQAGAICKEFGLSAFTFDAEVAFDTISHPDSAAVNLLHAFRGSAPTGTKAGWCWWAFSQSSDGKITYHPKSILWAAMASNYGNADFGIPMMYWSWGDDMLAAVKYLEESWRQWRLYTDKPLIPAGRAYIGDGGTPIPAAIAGFEKRARELGADGVAWWSMQHALDTVHLPTIWPALAALKPFGDVAPVPAPIPAPTELTDKQKLDLLWAEYQLSHAVA